jgi:hypothetical protein
MASTINASTSSGLVNTADTSGILQLQTANTTALTVDGSQNIGIGTTSVLSGYKVDVRGLVSSGATYGGLFSIYDTSGASQVGYFSSDAQVVANNDTNVAIVAAQTGKGIKFYTSGTNERMRIDSSGNLLVGTTADPSASVSGVKITNPGTVARSRWSCGAITTTNNMIAFCNGNGDVGTISVNGSATTYATSSDYRLKNTIAPMTGALAKIALLKPCTYKWKIDGSDGQGFIAHELAEVVPECVTGEKDAVETRDGKEFIVPQGIDTSFLVATLTAALQETKALIDTQAETINALTARIVALETA